MRYLKIASTGELKTGEKKKILVEGKTILLARIDNEFYAVDDRCTHLGGSLSEGTLEGRNIVCPRHGSIFDVTSGKTVEPGKLLFFKVKIRNLNSYPLKIEGNEIYLGLE